MICKLYGSQGSKPEICFKVSYLSTEETDLQRGHPRFISIDSCSFLFEHRPANMSKYTPLPQHAGEKASSNQGLPPPHAAKPAKASRLPVVLTGLSFLLFSSAVFLALGPGPHHHSHPRHHEEGYFGALAEDGFLLEPAYTLNPPMIHPHPSIEIAKSKTGHHGKQGHGPKPLPPKVAEGLFLDVPTEESCMELVFLLCFLLPMI